MPIRKRLAEASFRKDPRFRTLCTAFLCCKTETEVGDFLRDIGTLGELQAMSERLEVARLLADGKSYREIAKMTGASTTTVTRVAGFLSDGEGGYARYLKRR